ncbi:MAG: Ig domain-containing protein [Acidobacteria bacterium]|nr:Ig domain-containing protein [Acidobacteriota bacterium]
MPLLAAAQPQAVPGGVTTPRPNETTPPPSVAINSSCPSTAYAGVSYSCALAAQNGTGPYSFALKSGTLPPGLAIGDGRLSGAAGGPVPSTYVFVITVRDSSKPAAQTADRAYSITVLAGPVLGPVSIGPLVAGVFSSVGFTMTSPPSAAPLSFSAVGALPPGLSLSSGGTLSGAPSAPGTYVFSINGRDASSPPLTASRSYSVLVTAPPEVTPAAISSIIQGSAVAVAFGLSSPAVGPFQFSVNGNLPPGLTLSATGLLSGTATTPGTYSFVVVGRDQSSPPYSANRSYTVSVIAGPDIEPSLVPAMVSGQSVSVQFAMKPPTTAPVSFSSSGSIPPGLTLNPVTGLLSGIPSARGSYLMTINARDSSSPPRSASRSYAVAVADSPNILPATFPTLDANVSVSVPFSMTAPAVAPFVISITNTAALPPGLTYDAARNTLSGAPTAAGEYTFTVQGRDASSPPLTASQTYKVTVARQLSLVDSALPPATATAPYSATLRATCGTPPYRFEVTLGAVPGLVLSSAGVLAGTPTSASSRAGLSVRVTDSATPARSRVSEVALVINEAPVIRPERAPAAARGRPYSLVFAVERGTVPGPVLLDTGGLPPGLTLAQGSIFGTPTVTGSFTFTVFSIDANGARATRTVTIDVVPEVSFTTAAALPAGSVGAPYAVALAVAGGVAPYRFAVSGGALPPGLGLSADGRLSGAPTTEGSFSFAVTVSDSVVPPQTAVRTFTIVVRPILNIVTPSPLPDGTQGQFYQISFSAVGGVPPYSWTVSSGALPPGLSLGPGGQLLGIPSSYGLFGFAVQVNDANQRSTRRAYSIGIVRPPADPVVTDLNPDFIQFTSVEAGPAQSRPLQIASSSDTPEIYQATIRYEGPNLGWLSLAESTVAASRLANGSLRLTANPAQLRPGTYSARVVVNGSGAENLSMVVNLLVTRAVRQLVVTPVGLTFRATEAGVTPPPQTVAILNAGVGALNCPDGPGEPGGSGGWRLLWAGSGGFQRSDQSAADFDRRHDRPGTGCGRGDCGATRGPAAVRHRPAGDSAHQHGPGSGEFLHRPL